MEFKYLPSMGNKEASELVQGCLAALREDYRLNIEAHTFQRFPGRLLSFEEFIVMVMAEKDIENTLKKMGAR